MLGILLTPQTLSAQSTDEPGVEILSVKEDLQVLIIAHRFPAFFELRVIMQPLDAPEENTIESTTFNNDENDSTFKMYNIPPLLAGVPQIEIKLKDTDHNQAAGKTLINQTFANYQDVNFTWEILDPEQESSDELIEETPKPTLVSEPVRLTTASIEIIASKWIQSGNEEIKPEDPVPFIWPAEKRWLSGYNFSSYHPGIDIAASRGDFIFAAASGNVVQVSNFNRGFGNMVMIDHQNGYQTLYAHLNKILVETGSFVFQGQPIGLAGSTGNSSGVHLHFEIHHHGKFINPWLFFDN